VACRPAPIANDERRSSALLRRIFQPPAQRTQELPAGRRLHCLRLPRQRECPLKLPSSQRTPRRLAQFPGLNRKRHQRLQIRAATRTLARSPKARLAHRAPIRCACLSARQKTATPSEPASPRLTLLCLSTRWPCRSVRANRWPPRGLRHSAPDRAHPGGFQSFFNSPYL
jgi:hypothetical protein